MTQNKKITESSLSRIWKHNEEHDCGALTAFRKYHNCGYDDANEPCDSETPVLLSKKDNQKRNLALAADLKKLGYSITKVIGNYPEGGKTVKEISYFVVDINDKGNIKKDLQKLGEKYNQDSVLIIPKGSIKGEDKAYLIGTNNCCNNWLEKGKTEIFNKGKIGYDSPIYTSYVNGRPFIFEDYELSDDIFNSGTTAILAKKFSEFIQGEI